MLMRLVNLQFVSVISSPICILGFDSINNVGHPTPVTHGDTWPSYPEVKPNLSIARAPVRFDLRGLRSRLRDSAFGLGYRQIRGPITSDDNGEIAGYDRTHVVDIVRRIRR